MLRLPRNEITSRIEARTVPTADRNSVPKWTIFCRRWTLADVRAMPSVPQKQRLAAFGANRLAQGHPERAGQPGEVKIHYAGNASTRPKIEVAYKEKNVERPTRIARDLARVDATAAVDWTGSYE